MKTNKLFEAVGTGLVLAAWFLEWGSLAQLERNRSSLDATFQSCFQPLNDVETSYEIRLAHLKPLLLTNSATVVPLRNLAGVWQYEAIRQEWANRTIILMRALTLYNEVLQTYSATVKASPSWEELEKANIDINADFAKGLPMAARKRLIGQPMFPGQKSSTHVLLGNTANLTPDLSLMSFEEGESLNNRLINFQFLLQNARSSVTDHLEAAHASRTVLHRTLFAVGSAIVVFSFLMDWRGKKESAKKTTPNRRGT